MTNYWKFWLKREILLLYNLTCGNVLTPLLGEINKICSKNFNTILSLEFGKTTDKTTGETTYTNDILSMVSPEKGVVSLGKGLKARGNVEDWLGKVEEAMVSNLRKLTKIAVGDYLQKSRPDWTVAGHASQVVLTVSQIYWCKELTLCLSGDHDRLNALEQFLQVKE